MKARTLVACWLAAYLMAGSARAATLFDPTHQFQVRRTTHFDILFHQGEREQAERLAAIAEDVWQRLAGTFAAPPARTWVVLADESELANGFATPLPYDTVVITASWPRAADYIGAERDWLRMVFTHEFTHIVHLDRSRGWARVVRQVFGRAPLAFPNLFLPSWQIEGIATFEETRQTGEGRGHGGDFEAIASEAARARAWPRLDRVNGGVTDWPGGLAPYAYGLGFHQYLADRFGEATLGQLADATAGRVPYTTSRVFRRMFGESLGSLWHDYQTAVEAAVTNEAAASRAVRLTHRGFVSAGPRFVPATCSGCPQEIVYTRSTPDGFPEVIAHGDAGERTLTTRYLGSTVGVGETALIFDQQDLERNVALRSDLYELDRRSGAVTRLTAGARLLDPDLAPDQRTIVAVQASTGRRDLVTLSRDPGASSRVAVLVSEADTQFGAPKWSPDGRCVVAERHRLGDFPDIVVVDVPGGTLTRVAGAPGVRFATPAWRPDGRGLVVAAAGPDQPFNLYEIDLRDGPPVMRPLTHTTGGALWPDIAADGTRLVYVGYAANGFDLFEMAWPIEAGTGGEPLPAVHDGIATSERGASLPAAAVPYSPWPTLAPTSWSPVVVSDSQQLRLGVGIAGNDVLGYHAYAASASWLVSGPSSGSPAPGEAPDWSVGYIYDRWRPTWWAAASSATSFFSAPTTSGGQIGLTRRERQVTAGVLLPVLHVRHANTWLASLQQVTDVDAAIGRPDRTLDRSAARFGWLFVSAHTFGYSISPERGIAAGATVELVRRALGASADATSFTADLRGYLPAFRPHEVVALRFAGGVTSGDIGVGRVFNLGGAGPDATPLAFGSDAITLLRGFPAGAFAGTRVALVNAEYRFPIARPQRGVGTWPILVHTLAGALVADAGHAWIGGFDLRLSKVSIGGELTGTIVAGYSFPLTVAAGAAWRHDGSGRQPDGAVAYVRVGKSF